MKSLWGWIIGVIIIIAIIIGIVAATGNDNSNKNKATSNPPPATQSQANTSQKTTAAEVSIQNMLFTPSQVTINKGQTVTWTNNDSVAHTVTSDTGSELSSETIEPGAKYNHTFNTAGSFQYHCSIHSSMRGTIVVR